MTQPSETPTMKHDEAVELLRDLKSLINGDALGRVIAENHDPAELGKLVVSAMTRLDALLAQPNAAPQEQPVKSPVAGKTATQQDAPQGAAVRDVPASAAPDSGRGLAAARSALAERERPLRWLLSHCLAIGMTEKSIQDTPEHNICLFTINLKQRAETAEARAAEAEKDARRYQALRQSRSQFKIDQEWYRMLIPENFDRCADDLVDAALKQKDGRKPNYPAGLGGD